MCLGTIRQAQVQGVETDQSPAVLRGGVQVDLARFTELGQLGLSYRTHDGVGRAWQVVRVTGVSNDAGVYPGLGTIEQ